MGVLYLIGLAVALLLARHDAEYSTLWLGFGVLLAFCSFDEIVLAPRRLRRARRS